MPDTTQDFPTIESAMPPAVALSYFLTFDAEEDLREDLLAALGHDPSQRVQEDPTATRVAGDRLLRALARVQAESKQLAADRDDELRVVAMHYERKLGAVREREQRLTGALEALAATLIPADAKKKSLDLPFGLLKRKDTKASVKMVNADALAEHLSATELRDKVTVELTKRLPLDRALEAFTPAELEELGWKTVVAWGEVKKTLNPDGQLPPGVERVAPATAFEVEAYPIREGR